VNKTKKQFTNVRISLKQATATSMRDRVGTCMRGRVRQSGNMRICEYR